MINPLNTRSSLGPMLDNMRNGLFGGSPDPGRIEAMLVKYMDVVLGKDRRAKNLTEEEVKVMFYRYFGSQAYEAYDKEIDEIKLKVHESEEAASVYMTDDGEELLRFKDGAKALVRGFRRKLMPWDAVSRYMNLTPRQCKARFDSGRKKLCTID